MIRGGFLAIPARHAKKFNSVDDVTIAIVFGKKKRFRGRIA
jgi:hypothetical protein